ncbi:DUF4352 domain-containing protein [Streptomyces sp. CMB-StM0423]|uniref:DUF4352 domain-containing protein n=1 Tax=Streptomyces sp. CMB-StM0423 TaxID=2059884 RepID=UPI000C70FC43|nr:DUF4352 domain-containing protein [Streptomyces sp. CMB-StM0423]AUH40695.1 hypothetical protein CXR04_10935 [Streptomyces sp. CMB-StM0423]
MSASVTAPRRGVLAVAGAVAAVLALGGLTACGSEEPKTEKAGSAAQGGGSGKDSEKEEAPEGQGGALAPGDTAAYDDLKATVSEASPYAIDEMVEVPAGHKPFEVTVTLENVGDAKFDPTMTLLMARAGEEGNEAEEIFDGQVGGGFTGTVLPGKKATQKFAFFVPDGAKNLDVEVVVGDFEKEPATWSLPL